MDEKDKMISTQSVLFLALTSMTGAAIFVGGLSGREVGRSILIAIPMGIILLLPLFIGCLRLSKNFPGQRLFDIFGNGMGKLFSCFFIFVYTIINLSLAVSYLIIFIATVKTYFLQYTPIWAILLITLVLAVFISFEGLHIMARTIFLLVTSALISFMGIFVFGAFREFRMDNVTPIFDLPWINFLKGILISAGYFCEGVLFFIAISPDFHKTKKTSLYTAIGVIGWAMYLFLGILIEIGISGFEVFVINPYGTLFASKDIHPYQFISGLEIFILYPFTVTTILKTAIYLYSATSALFKKPKKTKYRFVIVVLALMIYFTAAYLKDLNKGVVLFTFLTQYILLSFCILFLLSLWIIKKFRIRGVES